MSTIPASDIVDVSPNVLSAGGSALDLNGLLLTTSNRVPIGGVQEFGGSTAVGDYFGAASLERELAGNYFAGYDNSNVQPGALLIAQYNTAAVAAWLRGGDVSDMTLAELQALNLTLSIVIDGALETATIDLAAATSFSNAAGLIADGLGIQGAQAATFTGSIAGTTLTVSAVATGALAVGQVLTGTGTIAGTYITALGTGEGGTGTYIVSDSQTASSHGITAFSPAVQYDSTSGAFVVYSGTTGPASTMAFGSGAMATSLNLTALTGAVLSQGAAIATPSAFMDALIQVNQNWATFTTAFNPDASGHANKLAFSLWTSQQDDRYGYIAWDEDLTASASAPAAGSFGAVIAAAGYSGTFPLGRDDEDYEDLVNVAAFVMGLGASIDFEQLDGRTTYAFRSQAGLAASVTDQTKANNLIANGYNFYGAYGTANDEFVFLYPGKVSGPFVWMDSFVNQIWMNNAFQLALMTLLINARSIPYNAAGYAKIEAACGDTITAAVNFGAIRAGVTLSAAQIAQVNSDAGLNIAPTLGTRGWYFQVRDASPVVRQARGSPPCTFWYMDGQSVQSINLASVQLQ